MTPDEFSNELRKKLVEPTEKYDVEGSYIFHRKENAFNGLFEIDTDGIVVGEIHDPNSVCPKHVVEGTVFKTEYPIDIRFVKIPTGILGRIYYHLMKSDEKKTIEGEYKGLWQFNEVVLKLDASDFDTEPGNRCKMTLAKI